VRELSGFGSTSKRRPPRRNFNIQITIRENTSASPDMAFLTAGQFLNLSLVPERDCYVGVWYQNEKGEFLQLFPNAIIDEPIIRAGQLRLISGEYDNAMRLKASKGVEYLHVVASTQPWRPFGVRRQGPYLIFSTLEEKQTVRNRIDEMVSFHVGNDGVPAEVFEHTLLTLVQPAK
jgi:hypothetical protein